MSLKDKKQDTEELLDALNFSKNTASTGDFFRKLKKNGLPSGKNAAAEKFMVAFKASVCLFNNNNAALMKHGEKLKDCTNKYAKEVPSSQGPFVINHLNRWLKKR